MLEMLGNTLLILFICVTIYRFYAHRHEFFELSKVEWLRYIFGFILSLTIGVTVIIGGIHLSEQYISGWLLSFMKIGIIFLGLVLISSIFTKFIPSPLKRFYKN